MIARRAGLLAAVLYVSLGAVFWLLAVFFGEDAVAFAPVVMLAMPTTSVAGDYIGIWAVALGVLVNAALFGGVVAGVTALVRATLGVGRGRSPGGGA